MSGPEREAWIGRAKARRIEEVAADRGLPLKRRGRRELVGACPECGGEDRFAINIDKQCFNCRGCGAKGDVIDLVRHIDGCDFNSACATLTGEPPPRTTPKEMAEPVVVAEFTYEDPNNPDKIALAIERIQYRAGRHVGAQERQACQRFLAEAA
jgi:CHC2 zinc finger